MIRRSNTISASKPEEYAAHPVPSLAEWQALWQNWDVVTRQMIPDEDLESKPIKLRNACIFYLGHIPTFLDMKLVQATGSAATEPSYFQSIFERGIDPDVDNPEHCHAHSEIPDEWPPLQDILEYQKQVRARVTQMYTSGLAYEEYWTGRVLWLGLEHEAMHLETLLYMLLQSDKTLPPSSVAEPDFEKLAEQARQSRTRFGWVDVPQQTISLGLNDPDNRQGPLRHFGWDVEKPERMVTVSAFKSANRPITNMEYAQYLMDSDIEELPVSWTKIRSTQSATRNGASNGIADVEHFAAGKAVRTIFGSVPLAFALDWPATASYNELVRCAAYMGGRIPTVEEARSIYKYSGLLKKRECLQSLQKQIPAVNG